MLRPRACLRLVPAFAILLLGGGEAAASDVQTLPETFQPSIAAIGSARVDRLSVHRLSGNPHILVFDFPTLEQQGLMFNRLVAMFESQMAPRDRVLTSRELEEVIRASGKRTATFAFGNDFRVSELVQFFNLADDGGVELNNEEQRLRAFLEEKNLIMTKGGFIRRVEEDRVILSIPQQEGRDGPDGIAIPASVRDAILYHEISHGEYYSNEKYADYCRNFWNNIFTESQRAAFRAFLGRKGYNQGNEELMVNETQAYLLHTPDPAAFNPGAVGLSAAEVESLRARFWAGNPPSLLYRAEYR